MSAWRSYLTDPPRGFPARNPFFKYGFLFIILGLLGWQAWAVVAFRDVPGNWRYVGFIGPLMLLFNHLSFCFYFGPRWTFPIRLFGLVFLVAGCGFFAWVAWDMAI